MTYFTSLNISKLELTHIFLPRAFHIMYWVKSLSDFDGPAFFETSNNAMNLVCKPGSLQYKIGKELAVNKYPCERT